MRAALLLAALLAPLPARALQVVAMPLDAVGTELFESARAASRVMLATLRETPGVNVMEAQSVSRELGMNLVDQVQFCRRDTFCLVQIGEAVGADRILVGEVLEKPEEPSRTLRLFLVDVSKAAMVDTLTWSIPKAQGALEDALAAAVRRLFAKPDAQMILEVEPKDAKLSIYGEPVELAVWTPISYWSGVYVLRVEAKGRVARDVRVTLPRGGPTRVVVELDPDLLYVDPSSKTKPTAKTGKVDVVPVDRESTDVRTASRGALGPSPFANWVAWSIVGAGTVAAVSGGLVMVGAQSDYNELSAQARFIEGTTTKSSLAIEAREDARTRFSVGSKLMIGGVVVAAGGFLWMLIDSASSPKTPSVALSPSGDGGVTCGVSF